MASARYRNLPQLTDRTVVGHHLHSYAAVPSLDSKTVAFAGSNSFAITVGCRRQQEAGALHSSIVSSSSTGRKRVHRGVDECVAVADGKAFPFGLSDGLCCQLPAELTITNRFNLQPKPSLDKGRLEHF